MQAVMGADRAGLPATIQVANAPCSWGVLEFDRTDSTPPYARVLDEMVETGYAGTELGDWGFLPADSSALAQELGRRRLALLGAFVPVAFPDDADRKGEAYALRVARLLAAAGGDAPLVVLADSPASVAERTALAGRIRPQHGLRPSEWRTAAALVERIAKAVREETGLRTVFHHHCATYVETPAEIAELLDRTDAGLVGLCLDTGHLAYGGGDPRRFLAKYGDRVWHVHFKDCDPRVAADARRLGWDYHAALREGLFCELGRGAVDFPGVLRDLRGLGYTGWIVVEQDVLPSMGSPAASAARNREYLRCLGL
jgi:inosose dehydratase